MNKKMIFSVLLSGAVAGSSLPLAVTANASDVVYGTMEIPYSEFYSSEGIDGVDTVSSATTNKWKNENLVKGTYSVETENGGGDILGVKYYVAVSENDLAQLDESYHFEKVDEVPQTYKNVTVENGKVVFSEIVGDTTKEENEVTMNTNMPWGDYVIDVNGLGNANGTSSFGTIYGVVIKTDDGSKYGMRHLENIWRDEIAWSSGIKKSEPHGNVFKYEHYESLMGKTIKEVTYITDTGYHTINVDLYVPVKFESSIEIENSDINAGSTAFITTGFPEDYEKTYFVSGNGQFSVEDGIINYKVQFPGAYNLEISDAHGKYATINTSFVISTDDMPAKFDGEKLVPADSASQDEFDAFIRNISAVTVDETTYSATGKRGLKLINDDGTIIIDAVSRDVLVFAEDKPYKIDVTATGYNNTLEFILNDYTKQEESSQPSEFSEVSENSEISEVSQVSEISEVSIAEISVTSSMSEISVNEMQSSAENSVHTSHIQQSSAMESSVNSIEPSKVDEPSKIAEPSEIIEPSIISEPSKTVEPSKTDEPSIIPEPSKNTLYNDGTYTGQAYGYDGDIYVTVTIQGDKITNITARSDEFEPEYFEDAEKGVIPSIINSQNTNVDTVSGATFSSQGIIKAVEQALNSAKI